MEGREAVLAHMQLLDAPVEATVLAAAAPNPVPLTPGQTLLQRIRERGIIRVGFNFDKLPFAYLNHQGDLVGYDINMAHYLAHDLAVQIEFVPFRRATLVEQLRQDHFDVVMSGLVGTLERSVAMEHTAPYMDVTLALVVPDYRVRDFDSVEAARQLPGLTIGFADLSQGFVDRLQQTLPNAIFVELATNGEFFEDKHRYLDVLLISAESGSAFTLLYPDFEVVAFTEAKVSLPLFYGIGAHDKRMRDFLEHWVYLRRKDGTMQANYEHWILGRSRNHGRPRWSVIRDVLGWIN